jgi:uncharacterized membrane protein
MGGDTLLCKLVKGHLAVQAGCFVIYCYVFYHYLCYIHKEHLMSNYNTDDNYKVESQVLATYVDGDGQVIGFIDVSRYIKVDGVWQYESGYQTYDLITD